MDTVLRLAALCLLGALLAVLLRRGGGELALLLVLAVCGVAVALLLEPLGQLRDFWEEASAWGQLPEQLFQPLLKTVCIALICRTGSDLCRDAEGCHRRIRPAGSAGHLPDALYHHGRAVPAV